MYKVFYWMVTIHCLKFFHKISLQTVCSYSIYYSHENALRPVSYRGEWILLLRSIAKRLWSRSQSITIGYLLLSITSADHDKCVFRKFWRQTTHTNKWTSWHHNVSLIHKSYLWFEKYNRERSQQIRHYVMNWLQL